MIVKALEASTGDLRALAAEIGVSYDTLWAWKAGRRIPSARNMNRLARAIDRRGAELRQLAASLKAAAAEED